ncbi:pyridoxal phosphate-dependent aminotransferase [Plantactinospora sp. WMMC1484]|uniref:pyridoxal phosphate-dependent aminotransferase n=1 Tax=Plantactinospora sp. WMMC1484 TaxID=3404122 RepID=UPI003BF5CE28
MTRTGSPTGLRFPAAVRQATAYVPDWSGQDRTGLIRLDRNEATAPLSPAVAEALVAHIQRHGVHGYPEYPRLVAALAGYTGLPAGWILPTNGSDQAIDVCLRAFLAPGATMLVARPEFVIFGHSAGLLGAEVLGVPYGPDLEFPYAEFRAAATAGPDLIVFVNPNNPTGTPVDVEFIVETVEAYPATPVVVDEAYAEFTGVTVAPLIERYPNLVVLRTFSKAFAMAGLRLGYVLARPEVVDQLVKIRNPFDVNALAVVAALAQLERVDEMRASVAETMHRTKPAVLDFFREHGVPVWPGAANFLLVRPGGCAETMDRLRAAGILVRRMTPPALAGTFRMNLGTPAEMTTFMDVYRELLPAPGGVEAKQ